MLVHTHIQASSSGDEACTAVCDGAGGVSVVPVSVLDRQLFLTCCGSATYADRMVQKCLQQSVERQSMSCSVLRLEDVHSLSDAVMEGLSQEDWLQAFSTHPRIGDREVLRKKFEQQEQSVATSSVCLRLHCTCCTPFPLPAPSSGLVFTIYMCVYVCMYVVMVCM